MEQIRAIAIAVLAVFASVVVFGLPMSMSNEATGETHMTECPLMADHDSVCIMNIMEHIGQWQYAFVAVLIAAFIFFIVAHSVLRRVLIVQDTHRRTPYHDSELPKCTTDPFEQCLARGKILPRLFA